MQILIFRQMIIYSILPSHETCVIPYYTFVGSAYTVTLCLFHKKYTIKIDYHNIELDSGVAVCNFISHRIISAYYIPPTCFFPIYSLTTYLSHYTQINIEFISSQNHLLCISRIRFYHYLLGGSKNITKTTNIIWKVCFWLVSHQSIQIRLLRLSDCRIASLWFLFPLNKLCVCVLYSFWFRMRATPFLEIENLSVNRLHRHLCI